MYFVENFETTQPATKCEDDKIIDGLEEEIKSNISKIGECHDYEGTDYLGKLDGTDYKKMRKDIYEIIKVQYDKHFQKDDTYNPLCVKKFFEYLINQNYELYELNSEKMKQINKLKELIDKQNEELDVVERKVLNHKNYDMIKQNRVISSSKMKSKSFTLYYILVGLIVVFMIIHILLLIL